MAKRYDLALAELLLAEEEEGDRMELAYYMGLCLAKLERYDEALLYLEQVVTTGEDPFRIIQCRLILALAYEITGRGRLAEFELRKLLDAGMESSQVYSFMAHSFYLQGKIDECVAFYERALELDSQNPTALNNLGFVLADVGKDAPKGLILCRRALDRKPSSAAYMDSLGWAHYKNGNLMEARKWLRLAREAKPQCKEILDHIKAVTGGAPL